MAVRAPSQIPKPTVSSSAAVTPSSSSRAVGRPSASLRSKLVHAYDSLDHSVSFRLQHLQNVASWASVNAPPLGAFLGSRLASFCESRGVPPPPQQHVTCERCESILLVGSNCTVRLKASKGRCLNKGANPTCINTVVYLCHYCSFENANSGSLKGYVKGKVSEISARRKLSELGKQVDKSTPKKSTTTSLLSSLKDCSSSSQDISNKKRKRKGWTSLKEVAELSKNTSSTFKFSPVTALLDTSSGYSQQSIKVAMAVVSESSPDFVNPGTVSEVDASEKIQNDNDLHGSHASDVDSDTSQDKQVKQPNPDIDQREQSFLNSDKFLTNKTEGNLASNESTKSTVPSSQIPLEEGNMASKQSEKAVASLSQVSLEDSNLLPKESEKTVASSTLEVCNAPGSNMLVQNEGSSDDSTSREKKPCEGVALSLTSPELKENKIQEQADFILKEDEIQEQDKENNSMTDLEENKNSTANGMDMEHNIQEINDEEKLEERSLMDLKASTAITSSITDVDNSIGIEPVIRDVSNFKGTETVKGAENGSEKVTENTMHESFKGTETEQGTGNECEKVIETMTYEDGTETDKETGIVITNENEIETQKVTEIVSMTNEGGFTSDKRTDLVSRTNENGNEIKHMLKTSNSAPTTEVLSEGTYNVLQDVQDIPASKLTAEVVSERRNEDAKSDDTVFVNEKVLPSVPSPNNEGGKTIKQANEEDQQVDDEMQNIENGVLVVEINEEGMSLVEREPEVDNYVEAIKNLSEVNDPMEILNEQDPVNHEPGADSNKKGTATKKEEKKSPETEFEETISISRDAKSQDIIQKEEIQDTRYFTFSVQKVALSTEAVIEDSRGVNKNASRVSRSQEEHVQSLPISSEIVIEDEKTGTSEQKCILTSEAIAKSQVEDGKDASVTGDEIQTPMQKVKFDVTPHPNFGRRRSAFISSPSEIYIQGDTEQHLPATDLHYLNDDTLDVLKQTIEKVNDTLASERQQHVKILKDLRRTVRKGKLARMKGQRALAAQCQSMKRRLSEVPSLRKDIRHLSNQVTEFTKTASYLLERLQEAADSRQGSASDSILKATPNCSQPASSSLMLQAADGHVKTNAVGPVLHSKEVVMSSPKKRRLEAQEVLASTHQQIQCSEKPFKKQKLDVEDVHKLLLPPKIRHSMQTESNEKPRADKVQQPEKRDITKTITNGLKTGGALGNGGAVKPGVQSINLVERIDKSGFPAREGTEILNSVNLQLAPRHEAGGRKSNSVIQQESQSNVNSEPEIQRTPIKKAPRFIRYGRRWFSVYKSNGCVKWRMV